MELLGIPLRFSQSAVFRSGYLDYLTWRKGSSFRIYHELNSLELIEKLPLLRHGLFKYGIFKAECSASMNGVFDSFPREANLRPSLLAPARQLADARVIYCAAPAMGHNQGTCWLKRNRWPEKQKLGNKLSEGIWTYF